MSIFIAVVLNIIKGGVTGLSWSGKTFFQGQGKVGELFI